MDVVWELENILNNRKNALKTKRRYDEPFPGCEDQYDGYLRAIEDVREDVDSLGS